MSQVIAHSLEINSRTKDVAVDGNITFESLMLDENVLKGLEDSGFRKPSPIQLKSVPVGRCGFDIIVKSKSGTGKTLVYSIIALETVEIKKHETQVLILAPTREIAVQIQEVIISIGSYFKGLKVESFIGGLPLEEDIEKCKNCHIAVGAPGRVNHLIREKVLKPNSIHLLVLDEVDKLMESSFINDINEIFNNLPDRKQIITTSATYPKELSTILNKYMLSPTYIEVEIHSPLLLGLRQFVKIIKPYASVIQELKFKNEALINLFSTISFTQCLIFTNYQTRAESISNFLNQKGWCSMYISAAQSQLQRLETVKDLKNFKCKILLSTDLTARGIDAVKVDLVINYDVPTSAVTYLHRMGRTGRYGSSGVCIDFVSSGVALHKWQHMLGLIGGGSLGIPKLPNCNGRVSDLLKLDIPSEDCIFGIIDNTYTPEINMSIKKNILDLKQNKNPENLSKENTISFNKLEQNTNLSEVNYKERENHSTDHSIKELYSKPVPNVQLSIPLNSQPSDDIINGPMTKQLISVTECKQGISCTDTLIDSRSNTVAKSEVKAKNALYPVEVIDKHIFYKNKALLYVTQILAHNKSTAIEPDLNALQCYLDAVKNRDKNEIGEIILLTKFRPVVQILKNINNIGYSTEVESKVEDNIENIFQIGYNYAIKFNFRHWSLHLPNSELSHFQNLYLKERKIANNSDESNQKEITYEVDKSGDEMVNEFSYGMANQDSQYDNNLNTNNFNLDSLKWIPIEKSDTISRSRENYEIYNWDNLNSYFNQCSDSLWQSGLCFESIEDFDDWFYHKWQTQVFNIRDYVQQNIYIQEMGHYQKSKLVKIHSKRL